MNLKAAAPAPTIAILLFGFTYLVTATKVNLKSGSLETGSTIVLVKLLALLKSVFSCLPQCIGKNTTPSLMVVVIFALTRTRLFLLVMSTKSPSFIPFLYASMGLISKKGVGLWVINRDTFPVLVMLCH